MKKAGSLFLNVFFLSVPVLILLSTYIYFDPFKVIWHYSNFEDHSFTAENRDYVSSDLYIRNHSKYHYNAFIFGNSRSLSFLCSDWKNYIPNAVPFHFDGSG